MSLVRGASGPAFEPEPSRYRLMDQRDQAGHEVARLREELRVAEARHRLLCQQAYDAGDPWLMDTKDWPVVYAVEVVTRETVIVTVSADSKTEARAKAREFDADWRTGGDAIVGCGDREAIGVRKAVPIGVQDIDGAVLDFADGDPRAR